MEQRICIECRHCVESEYYEYHGVKYICYALEVFTLDVVTGKKETSGLVSCYTARNSNELTNCGPEGKFWEKK